MKIREILDADILFVSLCQTGKNGLSTIYKAEGEGVELKGLTKALPDFDERGLIAACVWAPGRECVEGDFAGTVAIEKMAHRFMRNAGQIDMQHDMKALPKEAAYIAETFIIQKSDPRFEGMKYNGETVNVDGGWGMMIQVDDTALRKAYREGEWDGVSMFGKATVRQVQTETDKAEKASALRKLFHPENEMKTEEITAAITKGFADALKSDEFKAAVLEIAAPVVKEDPKDKVDLTKAPQDLDLSDDEALEKHARDLEIAALKKDVDFSNPADVRKYRESLAELKKKYEDEDEGDDESHNSNVSKGKGGGDGKETMEDRLKKCREHAQEGNKVRGLA